MSEGPRILVVEDDAALSDIVCSFLSGEGYACTPAFSGTEALLAMEAAAAGGTGFDLAILDLMLPGIPGEELIGRLRGLAPELPIVVASAKGTLGDRVGVLRLGANDYLVKPFDLEELLARVEVQLRSRPGDGPEGALTFGEWRLDPASRTFVVAGEPVALTRTEFDLLAALMRNPGRVVTKHELYEAVWGEDPLGDERTVATHMGNLRAKLRASGTDAYLQTVWGIGFKLASA